MGHITLLAHPKLRHLSVYPWSGALNVAWVACTGPASCSTNVTATVDLLAVFSLSCLWPECHEEGQGASCQPPSQALFVRPWRAQPLVDWYCLALVRSTRHRRETEQADCVKERERKRVSNGAALFSLIKIKSYISLYICIHEGINESVTHRQAIVRSFILNTECVVQKMKIFTLFDTCTVAHTSTRVNGAKQTFEKQCCVVWNSLGTNISLSLAIFWC